MSIFSIHTAESAPEAARPILGSAARKFGFVPNKTAGSGPNSPSTAIFATLPVTASGHPGNLG